MSKLKIVDPSNFIIEKTAGEFAGVWYDAARSSGLTIVKLQNDIIDLRRYKRTRDFARRHLEKFIPAAVNALTDIMSNPNTAPAKREAIYNALMERVNDPQLGDIAKLAGNLPEFEQTILYKTDQEKPKPIIINTSKLDLT